MVSMDAIDLNRRVERLEKKMSKLIGLVEDLRVTPQQYAKAMKVRRAVGKGTHRKWKTIEQALAEGG
ncbi:MAG: hypothetical protein V1909_03515 [Candidatus Micrarchaeota archaeon]